MSYWRDYGSGRADPWWHLSCRNLISVITAKIEKKKLLHLICFYYSNDANTTSVVADTAKSGSSTSKQRKIFPEEAIPDLIRLIHVNANNKLFLAKEFAAFWEKKNVCKSSNENKVNIGFSNCVPS